jgi:Sap-like sulfolipid-1-addressing protein
VAAGIGAILTYAVGVAISPMSIIAVILMLFSARARVNGLMLLGGWLVALTVLFALAYWLADAADAATDTTASETVSWGKIAIGAVLLLLAARQWRSRPAPGVEPAMPKWMAGIDSFSPGKAFALGLIAVAAPKNLLLSLSAGTALAQVGVSTSEAVVCLIVFLVVSSVTIGGPVLYYRLGGGKATSTLDGLKDWLTVHNAAVMAVLLLVIGVKLVGDGLPGIGG